MEFLRERSRMIRANNPRINEWVDDYLDGCFTNGKSVNILTQWCISKDLEERFRRQGNDFVPTRKERRVFILTLYLLFMVGGTMGVVYATSGYIAPHSIQGLALLWLNGMLFLSLSLWGGSFLSTLTNGVVAFGLFGVAFVGGWMEQIGSFLENPVAVNIGILSSLIFPCEAVWRRTVYLMQSPLVTRLGVSFFSSSSVPSRLMILYAVIYAGILLIGAVRRFNRRDL